MREGWQEASSAMQSQNMSEVVATCVAVLREFQAAAFATSAGISASEDDTSESGSLGKVRFL